MVLRIGILACSLAALLVAALPSVSPAQGLETEAVCRSIQKQHSAESNRIRVPLGSEIEKARAWLSRGKLSERYAGDAIRSGCQRLAKSLWNKASNEYQRAQREISSPRVTTEARRKGTDFTRTVTNLRFDIQRASNDLRRSRAELTRLHGNLRPTVGTCRTKSQTCPRGDTKCQEELEKLPLCP